MKPDSLFRLWTPDQVAECLPVSTATYKALWQIVEDNPRPFCETPDGLFSYSLSKYWKKLDAASQADCNRAASQHMKDSK